MRLHPASSRMAALDVQRGATQACCLYNAFANVEKVGLLYAGYTAPLSTRRLCKAREFA